MAEILDLIIKRDKLLKNFHRSKDELIYKDFCKTRNMVQRLIKETKRQYILEQTEKSKKDSKKLWSVLKFLGYNDKCKSKEPMILNINNSVCFDPVTIANYTNCFFINIAQKLVNALPSLCDLYSAFSQNCVNFYKKLGVTPNSFKLREVTPTFVNQQLKNLKINKSTGLDNIGPRFLNDGADALTGIITYLINLSIKNKTVPNCTKVAKVTPLFKKNNKLEIGNYRPVSVLTSI